MKVDLHTHTNFSDGDLSPDELLNHAKKNKIDVIVGKLSPGIMITDFITHSMGDDAFELPEKTKKVYNILGDYPDVISKFFIFI